MKNHHHRAVLATMGAALLLALSPVSTDAHGTGGGHGGGHGGRGHAGGGPVMDEPASNSSQTVAMTYACPPLASYSDCRRGHPVDAVNDRRAGSNQRSAATSPSESPTRGPGLSPRGPFRESSS